MNDTERSNSKGNSRALAPTPPVIQASFAGPTQNANFTRQPDKSSRESLGIWFLNGRAWKIVANGSTFVRVNDDYNTARDQGLPIGNPVVVERGTVRYTREGGRELTSQGFVVVAPQFTGEFFQGATAFKSALNRVGLTKASPEYPRLVRDCTTARRLGLQDCQGFFRRLSTGVTEPINFTDIHLDPTRPEAAQALLDVLNGLPDRLN
ncbi:hypothetical protein Clacol_005624 [Clathrus columnatus]|uniref:Uncharacterized protein n=1 Tax=Clathrus columnatus TaxID=1419009 RepID=A0AAV5AFX6_9AGAM|nr:hypothetical protein Clacol_005624 [Clathrus columnatus]